MKLLLFFCITFGAPFLSNAQSFVRSELPTSVSNPWEITFGPDNFLWITEFGGKVSRVNPTNGNKTVIYTAPDYYDGSPLEVLPCVQAQIGAGTFGLALHPNFMDTTTSYLYFVYSYNSGTIDTPITKLRIKRLKWDFNSSSVTNDSDIVNLIPTGHHHIGGRLKAIKQNNIPYLFLSTGDHGVSEIKQPDCYSPPSSNPNNYTQDINTQQGKILRFNIDGSIPIDNPVSGNPFYTRGHRNPQGIIHNSSLGIIYAIEHGDITDDEINVLYKGMNYGWREIRGYRDDNNYPGEADYAANYIPNPSVPNDSLVDPLYSWCTTLPIDTTESNPFCTVAPSGGTYYGSTTIPEWTNSLLVVTLKDNGVTDKEVYQFKLLPNGDLAPSVVGNPNPKKFFGNDQSLNGRLRDITISNDGKTVYLINNGGTATDKITVYSLDSTTSIINTKRSLLKISLHPNPTTDLININGIEDLADFQKIDIFTSQGKLIFSGKSYAKVDVSSLNEGVYFLNIVTDKKTYPLKFIKY